MVSLSSFFVYFVYFVVSIAVAWFTALRSEFIDFAGHEVFVFVADPVTVAGDAPDEMEFFFLAEDGMIVQKRYGHGVAFIDGMDKAFALFIGINFHRTAALGKNVNLLLVGVVVRRVGALMRAEDRIAGDEFVRRFAHVEHQEH